MKLQTIVSREFSLEQIDEACTEYAAGTSDTLQAA